LQDAAPNNSSNNNCNHSYNYNLPQHQQQQQQQQQQLASQQPQEQSLNVEAVILQNQVDTLQWQLKQVSAITTTTTHNKNERLKTQTWSKPGIANKSF